MYIYIYMCVFSILIMICSRKTSLQATASLRSWQTRIRRITLRIRRRRKILVECKIYHLSTHQCKDHAYAEQRQCLSVNEKWEIVNVLLRNNSCHSRCFAWTTKRPWMISCSLQVCTLLTSRFVCVILAADCHDIHEYCSKSFVFTLYNHFVWFPAVLCKRNPEETKMGGLPASSRTERWSPHHHQLQQWQCTLCHNLRLICSLRWLGTLGIPIPEKRVTKTKTYRNPIWFYDWLQESQSNHMFDCWTCFQSFVKHKVCFTFLKKIGKTCHIVHVPGQWRTPQQSIQWWRCPTD